MEDRLFQLINDKPEVYVWTLAVGCATLVALTFVLSRAFLYLVRGWPKARAWEPRECASDDNMTGVCLKACKSRDECWSACHPSEK